MQSDASSQLVDMEVVNGSSFMKYGSFVSIVVLILAYSFRTPPGAMLDDRLDNVLSSLLRAERKVGIDIAARPKVAIGKRLTGNFTVN